MYVYIWKTPDTTPFYVGLTKNKRRTNPRNNGGRNWLCRQRLGEIGADNVIVEIRPVGSVEVGEELEKKLILEYGRIDLGTGTLTNLRAGGEGTHVPSAEHRQKLREALKNPNHPIHSAGARAQAKARMNAPDIKERFIGDNNPAKKPENRAKLKAVWENPEYREKQAKVRTGKPKNFSAEDLAKRADALKNNPKMKSWGERNGKDAEFDAKRIDGIRAAQPKRAEKMRDPVALAQRKARLAATLNSPEHKARRAAQNTPEYRAAMSARKKEYWAKKRAEQAVT